MLAITRLFVYGSIFLSTGVFAETMEDTLMRLRALPEEIRIEEFGKLEDKSKEDLFFLANQRHPPYTGLVSALAQQDIAFLSSLRSELVYRHEVQDVLAFLLILHHKKSEGMLSRNEVKLLKLNDFCSLALQSKYCPELLSKVVGDLPQ